MKPRKVLFKHWARKSYSAFNSIGKVVAIATLNVVYFVSLGEMSAQENQEGLPTISKNVDLEEVEVVAETSPQLASEAARVVEVISKKEIQEASAQSINEILEFALGVDIRQRGRHGMQADLSVRGGTFDQVMILLNGVNITDPQTGHLNLNLPVDISSIERIEILEGPGARYWGPNAFTGAINFVTKQKEHHHVTLALSGGEYGYGNVTADAGIKHGKFSHYLSLGEKISDGYIPNADYNMFTGYYNLGYEDDLGKASFQAGYIDKSFGANTFYTPAYPYQYEQNRTLFASAKYETKGAKFRFSPQVYVRRNHDRFETIREEGYFEKTDDGFRVMGTDTAPGWYNGHNYHMTTIVGGELNGKFYSNAGITSFGINMRNEQIYSSLLGTPMNDTLSVPHEPDGLFTKSANRLNSGIYLEHFYAQGNFAASAGLMANHNTFDNSFGLYPGLDVSYQLTERTKMYGSATSSFRMPTFTDLYYSGPQNVGNPDLKPETAWTYEAGLKYRLKGFRAHAAVFLREAQNLIDWVQVDSADAKFTTVNHNEAQTFGVETSAQWNPRAYFGNEFFISSVKLTYGYLDTQMDTKGLESGYAGDYLKHKFTTQVTHDVYNALSANWGIRYQDRAGQYRKYEDGSYVGFVDYDPFWLLDLKLMWTKPRYQVYVEASNLLDKDYVDFGNVIQPGRWVVGGFKVHF